MPACKQEAATRGSVSRYAVHAYLVLRWLITPSKQRPAQSTSWSEPCWLFSFSEQKRADKILSQTGERRNSAELSNQVAEIRFIQARQHAPLTHSATVEQRKSRQMASATGENIYHNCRTLLLSGLHWCDRASARSCFVKGSFAYPGCRSRSD